MEIAKVKINPEKEYDTLRQEILKRVEMQYTLVNLTLTFVAVFLGLGLENNLIAFLVPPLVTLIALLYKTHSVMILRISNYMIERFESQIDSSVGWEAHNKIKATSPVFKRKNLIVNLGPLAIFTFLDIISISIGLFKFHSDKIQVFLLIVDGFSVIMTVVIFRVYSARRIRRDN